MTANERRAEILRILVSRRHEIIPNLPRDLAVCERTIRRDILTLMADHPLEVFRGNGGCVNISDWYHPHHRFLSMEQQQVLTVLMAVGNEHQTHVLSELLFSYGSVRSNEIGGTR